MHNTTEAREDSCQTVVLDLDQRQLRERQARLKGNLQLIETGFATFDQVFLANIVTGSGRTVLEAMEHVEVPTLPAPREG